MVKTNTEIADRIIQLIEALNLSKNEFAKQIGISSSLISQITTKKNSFRIDILQKITSKYPVSITWLLNGIGDMWGDGMPFTIAKNKTLKRVEAQTSILEQTQNVPFHNWKKVDEMIKNNNPDLYELNRDIDIVLGFKDVIFTLEENLLSNVGNAYFRFPKGNFDLNEYEANIIASLKEIQPLKEGLDKITLAILEFYKEMKKQKVSDIDFDAYSLNRI